MITFAPKRGTVLMCDFDLATVPPEMRKVRRVVVLSPRSYNRPHGGMAGKCVVVPFSATPPRMLMPSHVAVPAGIYRTLSKRVWAIGEMIAHVSHTRLDRVAVGKLFLAESLRHWDIKRIEEGVLHAIGIERA